MEIVPGINVKKQKRNPTLDSDNSIYEMPFYKEPDYFFNLENYTFYIKEIERAVRRSKEYKRYVAHIKKDIGLNFCQVKGNIVEDEETGKLPVLEMHHGPILTLFDCIAIVLEWSMVKGENISTLSIADRIIQEHYDHHIQTVMLCETVHQEVHEFNIFLNMAMGFGDINAFLEKYKEGLLPEQIVKINRYIDLSKKYDSFDKDVMKVNDTVTKWSKEIQLDDLFD